MENKAHALAAGLFLLLLGLALGKKIRYRLSEARFRALLLAFLTVLATVLLFK